MGKKKVAEILNMHADSLQSGADESAALLAANPDQRGVVAGLFTLAGRVYGALAPVEPAPDFVADLKRQLIANAERARAVTRHERAGQRRTVAVAASAGGLVYALGLAALALRAGISTAGLVAALLTRRRRAQAAHSAPADA